MQLDLFSWSPKQEGAVAMSLQTTSVAAVLPFPQSRNVGKARHVAERLVRRPEGRARDAYWTQICVRMATTLSRAGLNPNEIDREIRGFGETVGIEMGRLMTNGAHRWEDGHERYS